MEDGEDVQRAEKVTLKRKLTGPPRLLLGKTRTRSVGEDRPEALIDKHKTENTESSAKDSAASESHTAEQTANMDDVLSEVNVECSRGRCGAAGEEDDIRNTKVNRRRWWRRFSSTVVCNRKQKRDLEESVQEQKNDGSVPPEGALQEAGAATLNDTEENTEGTKGKKRFNVRTWPTFRRLLTSTSVRRTHELKTMTFRKRMQNFFGRGGKSRSSGVPLENMGDMMKCEEDPCSSVAQVDEPTERHTDVTVPSLEVVMVAAEVSVQLTERPAENPDQTPAEEQLVCDMRDAVNGSEMIQTDSEAVEGCTGTNIGYVGDLMEVESPEKDEVFSDSTDIILDADDQRSTSTTSSKEASEVHCEEQTDKTTSRSLQPSTNGPSIRIELVPPDDVTQEDEEEECWEGSSSSENHNHLLLLLGFEHSERQLVQTARSLVRAAMNAAVDQLTREQQSDSDCVQREPPGCRDHAR